MLWRWRVAKLSVGIMSMMNTESVQVEKEKWEMHSAKCVADDMQTQSSCMQTMTNIELELDS